MLELTSEMKEGRVIDEQHKRGKNIRVLETILLIPEPLSHTKQVVQMGFKSRGWGRLKEGLSRVGLGSMTAYQRLHSEVGGSRPA